MHGVLLSCPGCCPLLLLGIVRQATKTNMQDCWSLTCCFSWILCSSLSCGQLKLFYKYYFSRCSSELAQLVPLPFSQGKSTCYSNCMIFLSSFLDATRMSMSTVFFLAQLGSGIISLHNAFFWHMILVDLSLELTDIFYLQILSKQIFCML